MGDVAFAASPTADQPTGILPCADEPFVVPFVPLPVVLSVPSVPVVLSVVLGTVVVGCVCVSKVALVLGIGRIVGAVVVAPVLAVVSSFPLLPQAHRENVRTSISASIINFFIIILLLFVLQS